ncbi:MAG: hypothetical protein ACE5G2_07985, partial [Candidatus Krumholzibacteriia bacterium]
VGSRLVWIPAPGHELVVLQARGDRLLASRSLATEQPVRPPLAASADDRVWCVHARRLGLVEVDLRSGAARLLEFPVDMAPSRLAALAWDARTGLLWAADVANHRLLAFRPQSDAEPVHVIGHRGNGPGEFNYPTDIATFPDGSVLVLDALNGRLQQFDAAGRHIGVYASGAARLQRPTAMTVGPGHRIWVYEASAQSLVALDANGLPLLDGEGARLHLRGPGSCAAMAANALGEVWVADPLAGTVSLYRAPTPPGTGSPTAVERP